MRLIDADALKQDLTRFYDNEVTARKLIDEQPTVSGWISVKDILPDEKLREKVIKAIEYCRYPTLYPCKYICPYRDKFILGDSFNSCMDELLSDTLTLLKEQEAVEPITDNESGYWCGSCHEDMVWHQKYCSNCGKQVKWND